VVTPLNVEVTTEVTVVAIVVVAVVAVVAVVVVEVVVAVEAMALPSPLFLLPVLSSSSRGLARVWLLMVLALVLSKWVTPSMLLVASLSAAKSLLLRPPDPLVLLVSHVEPLVARMVSAALFLVGSPRLLVLASDAPLVTIVRLVSSLRSGVIKR
jgi:hypothetical protein